MKILHMVCDLIRGGSEGQCARTAMGLQALGIECRVAVFYRQGFFLDQVEEVCGPVYEINIRKALSLQTVSEVRALSEFIKAEGFDVIQTWDAESAVFGAPGAVMAGVPLITSRRDLGQIYPAWKNKVMNWADRKAVRVVANAEAIADHFSAQGLPREKIQVIGNILDLNEFDQLADEPSTFLVRRSLGEGGNLQPSTCNFICIARLDPEKDHETLLKAFALALSSGGQSSARPFKGRAKRPAEPVPNGTGTSPSRGTASDESPASDLRPPTSLAGRSAAKTATLHLIGDGTQRLFLQKLTEELGIKEYVHFHGERSDIPALLQDMDIGILTPKSNEGLSNTIMEYMAAGLPVIATDCGGNRELVEGADCGFIVPVGDPESCAAAIQECITEGNLSAIGHRGRTYIEKNHQPDVILEKFKTLYDRIKG